MKKKRLTTAILGLTLLLGLVACGGGSENNPSSSQTPSIPSSEPGSSNEPAPTSSSDPIPGPTSEPDTIVSSDPGTNDDAIKLAEHKKAAHSKLDELVNPVIAKISNETLKAAVQYFYDQEKQYIDGIVDLEIAKAAVNKVIEDVIAFATNTFKPLVIETLNATINPLIEKISDEGLKNSIKSFYDNQMATLASIESLSDIADAFKDILDKTIAFIGSETEKVLIALKNKAIEELDPFMTALFEKIPFDTLKEGLQTFYNNEKKKIEAIENIEDIDAIVSDIKDDLKEYALSESKKLALSKIEEMVNAGLLKIKDLTLKADLKEFADNAIAKINAIVSVDDMKTTILNVISDTQAHIKGILGGIVKEYFKKLRIVETRTAYDYLPSAMHPSYQGNIVDASSINYDFTSFTNVADINKAGYGEQWQMVVENINQNVAMAKVFNVAQTVLNAAGAAIDAYVSLSYNDEMSLEFNEEEFTGTFAFNQDKLVFDIQLVNAIEVPAFGVVKPVIKMEYDLNKDARGVFISLGGLNKVKYVITDNSYEMATTYGLTIKGKTASRSTYLSIAKDNDKTTGHIYEYTTLEGKDLIKACADFYVENGYVSVVGNKASEMIAFDGYINELYLANEGRLIGYEVREELTVAGVTGTYNTLWFNLWDIEGINNVKVMEKTEANESEKSTVDVYLNNSSSLLSPTYNKKLMVKTSRKYDVELRARYYYTYDAENDKYVANEVQVPMMFIQEGDNFASFSSDILKDNGIEASVSLSNTYLNKILDDYDTLIDIFITNKDNMSSEQIIAFLNQYE